MADDCSAAEWPLALREYMHRARRRSAHSFAARILCALIIAGAALLSHAQTGSGSVFTVLKPDDFHHYVIQFAVDEQDATGRAPGDEWPWMAANIPLFASSNKQFEEMYYFRWYAWQKHLVYSPHGYIITEWLPKPADPAGFFGALPDAAPFHLAEARWLRNPQIAADYARMWADPNAGTRKYSFPWADCVRNVTLATGNPRLGIDLVSDLIKNYTAWDDHLDRSVGLYWQIDTRDAMEKSIGGDGYRTPLNSYMLADAHAISDFAAVVQPAVSADYAGKADSLKQLIETKLWNPKDEFYEDLSPAADSGIRREKKFKDPGTNLKFAGVRELIGYIPWESYAPTPSHDIAWKQLFSPEGFQGKYGPTTAERRSPHFRFASSDQCTWNGPSWPYATTQTLLALADLLNGAPQPYIGPAEYYRLFSNYVLSQHIKLANGRVIDWIDEDLDADTDEWIAKDMLIEKHSPQVGRGNYYNHSGFADPLITGLIGIRPRADEKLVIHPLLPPGAWTYFAIDGLPYHGHLLTILYDQTGNHFKRGRGLMVFADGKKIRSRDTLGPLEASLSSKTVASR